MPLRYCKIFPPTLRCTKCRKYEKVKQQIMNERIHLFHHHFQHLIGFLINKLQLPVNHKSNHCKIPTLN